MTAMTLACLAKENEASLSFQKALASLYSEYNTILTTHVWQRCIENEEGTENGHRADQTLPCRRRSKPTGCSAQQIKGCWMSQ